MSIVFPRPGQPQSGGPVTFPRPSGLSGGGSTPPSSFDVWPINPQFTMIMSKGFASVIADLGDGFEQRKNNNETYVHADGQGGVTSHKGRFEFQIKLNGIDQSNGDTSKDVNTLWKFITDREGQLQAFYFYNPIEASIDLTGASTIGRYLVRLKDSVVSLEVFALRLHRGQISLIEVRA